MLIESWTKHVTCILYAVNSSEKYLFACHLKAFLKESDILLDYLCHHTIIIYYFIRVKQQKTLYTLRVIHYWRFIARSCFRHRTTFLTHVSDTFRYLILLFLLNNFLFHHLSLLIISIEPCFILIHYIFEFFSWHFIHIRWVGTLNFQLFARLDSITLYLLNLFRVLLWCLIDFYLILNLLYLHLFLVF